MKYLSAFLLFTLNLAILFSGCDKVKVNPDGQDFTMPAENQRLDFSFAGDGPFEFSILDKFSSSVPLTLSIITQARNGKLQLQSNGNFSYKPLDGFSGIDSARYRICSESKCHEGMLLFQINSLCQPIVPDLFIESIWGLNQIIPLPDSFSCGSLLKSVSGNPQIRLLDGVVLADLPENRVDTSFFQVIACNRSNRCDTGNVRLISGLNQCKELFSLQRDTFRLNRNFSAVSINLNLLLTNDRYCQNDLDPMTLEAGQPASGTSLVRHNVQGNFIRYSKANPGQISTDSLVYRLKTRSGAESSATLIILTE